uniref:Helicase_C_4 domain-containing protein n=1 Tax=Macrostomum lignano TaxID=282301 RepID=A0A1I8FHF6_9PLAT
RPAAALVGDLGHLNCDTGRGRAALRRLYQYTAAGRLLRGVSLPEVFDGEVSTEQEASARLQACLLDMDIFERLAEPSGKCRLRDGETGSVNRFLNRLLGLLVAEQACLFRYFLAPAGSSPRPALAPQTPLLPAPLWRHRRQQTTTAWRSCAPTPSGWCRRQPRRFSRAAYRPASSRRQVTAVTLEITRRLRLRHQQPHQSQQRTPQRTVTERLTLLCG